MCTGMLQYLPHASSLLSLGPSLAPSYPLSHIITLRHGLRKFQQVTGLVSYLTVLTVLPIFSACSSVSQHVMQVLQATVE